MAEPIIIEFDNQLADHLTATRLLYKSSFWAKGDKVVAALLFASGILLLVAIGPRWWTLIWIPLAVCEWFNVLSPSRLQARLIFKQNPKFRETYHLRFSDDGIDFKTKSFDSRISWNHYSRILEDNSVILLMYGSRMYTVIPKRVFEDDSTLSAFREMVGRHIPGKSATAVPVTE
jgi:hypothetical protein